MRRALPSIIPTLLLASLLGSISVASAEPDYPTCDQRAPKFRPAVRLGTGFGYEPSIETDSKGTIYVMAHKLSLAAEGSGANSRTASWLWRSTDDGNTFVDMDGVAGVTDYAYAFEGDGAVDANDVFYYVDTWAGDNHFSRYTDRGATLEQWRPVVFSLEPADDRPWVAAHGDGFVYYMSNGIVGTGARGRLTVHRSTDGGLTFDPLGSNFPNSLWGFVDADPNSPYVYAYMDETNTNDMVVWVSPDRGINWTRRVVADVPSGSPSDLGFPNIAVSPVDGTLYAEFDTDDRLFLVESHDHGQTWTVHDVSPFPGKFAHPWVTVGPTGDVGLVFDADPANATGGNFVYGMIWRPASDCLIQPENVASLCTGPAKAYARLQTGAVPSQEHFIQGEFTPDNALAAPFQTSSNQLKFTKQLSGPNMDGTPFCGTLGKA